MATVSQSIPNLLGGVSQQPDPLKVPGQVREAVNVYLDPTFGCRKRPATEFVAKLADDIPASAKWFPIFRDNSERYLVAIYTESAQAYVRVFDVSGEERTVVYDGAAAADYLRPGRDRDLHHLSLSDYTLVCNPRVEPGSSSVADTTTPEALVIVNQVAYNTTYSIDLAEAGSDETTKVYKATKLSVSPASWEDDDETCEFDQAEDFLVDYDDNSENKTKGEPTGLAFRLITTGNAYREEDTEDEYVCRYQTDVILRNGGVGWRKGDRVKVRMQGKDYRLKVEEETFVNTYANDGVASYVTPSNTEEGPLNIADVCTSLVSSVNAISGYEAATTGNVVRVRRTNGSDFGISARGGTVNSALAVIKESASDISKLPNQCFPDYVVKVVNTEEASDDDYFVKFISDSPGAPGTGSWEETVKPGEASILNPSSMPWTLVREADGTFTFAPLDADSPFGGWASREVGDANTNPNPSFIGKGITSMFVYSNRLGFVAGDAIIMSQPGDYFNFFNSSAIALSDADPIDLSASSEKPVVLQHAIGTAKGLLVFSEHAQFSIATDEVVFSSSTVQMKQVTDYSFRSDTRPMNTGMSVMFSTESDTYSKVFELSLDSLQNRPEVADSTRAIPQYIPTGLKWSTTSPNNDFVLFSDQSDILYTFKFYNGSEGRVLAGWSKWKLPADCMFGEFDKDTLFTVGRHAGQTILLRTELLDPSDAGIDAGFSTFAPRLDHVVDSSTINRVNGDDFDKHYFPEGAYVDGAQPVVLLDTATFFRPEVKQDAGGYYVETLAGRVPATGYHLGLEYVGRVDLPSFYFTQEKKADRVNIPQIQYVYVNFYYSGRYTVEVDRVGYDVYTQDIDVADTNVYIADAPAIEEDGASIVPIFCRGDLVKMSILARDPFPQSITNYTWQGQYNTRSIKRL